MEGNFVTENIQKQKKSPLITTIFIIVVAIIFYGVGTWIANLEISGPSHERSYVTSFNKEGLHFKLPQGYYGLVDGKSSQGGVLYIWGEENSSPKNPVNLSLFSINRTQGTISEDYEELSKVNLIATLKSMGSNNLNNETTFSATVSGFVVKGTSIKYKRNNEDMVALNLFFTSQTKMYFMTAFGSANQEAAVTDKFRSLLESLKFT